MNEHVRVVVAPRVCTSPEWMEVHGLACWQVKGLQKDKGVTAPHVQGERVQTHQTCHSYTVND